MRISKARWLNFGKATDNMGNAASHMNEVWIHYFHSIEEPWSKVSLLKGRKKKAPCRVAKTGVIVGHGEWRVQIVKEVWRNGDYCSSSRFWPPH